MILDFLQIFLRKFRIIIYQFAVWADYELLLV
jgi:hypothetical protein